MIELLATLHVKIELHCYKKAEKLDNKISVENAAWPPLETCKEVNNMMVKKHSA